MNHQQLADQANDAASKLNTTARREARKINCRIYSRGFEFLSLDQNEERDEEIVDYCDRDEMTPELVAQMAEQCRAAGSAYLAIGYGVDAADTQAAYDDGDYEPMYDWVDLPNIALKAVEEPQEPCNFCEHPFTDAEQLRCNACGKRRGNTNGPFSEYDLTEGARDNR